MELHVEETLRVDFRLELGTLTETTEVIAATTLIATENATVGTVIENRRIVELPLNGRNYLSLIALSPNVSAGFAGPGQAGDRQGGSRASQQISISGQRREFNYYTLDGVDNTDVNFNTYIFLPSVDALEEFKVQTGIYSAEFGRAAGQVNVVTKSGSNAFHGTRVRVPPQRQVRRPSVRVHGRSGRGAEGAVQMASVRLHGRRPGDEEPAVLHVELRGLQRSEDDPDTTSPCRRRRCGRGDFSALRHAAHSIRRRARSAGSDPERAGPLPGNSIPANRIHPTSQQLLEFYPGAEHGGHARTTTSPSRIARSTGSSTRQRMDFVQERRVDLDGPVQLRPRRRGDAGVEVERHEAAQPACTRLMIGNTCTLSPTVLNEFRFGFNYFFNTFGRELAFERDVVTELGDSRHRRRIRPSRGAFRPSASPGTTASATAPKGHTPTGTRCSSSSTTCRGFSGQALVQAGRKHPLRPVQPGRATSSRAATFQFDGRATGSFTGPRRRELRRSPISCWATCAASESAVALAMTKFRAMSQAYYFTDTWRMRHNMTLDLGLRYEYTPPWLDKSGTLMNAYLPFHDTGAGRQDLSRHPVLVRIGSGDFYEDSLLRFAPNIQVARDGTPGRAAGQSTTS